MCDPDHDGIATNGSVENTRRNRTDATCVLSIPACPSVPPNQQSPRIYDVLHFAAGANEKQKKRILSARDAVDHLACRFVYPTGEVLSIDYNRSHGILF